VSLSQPPPEPGLYAGKYRLVREIGQGGMGSVHEALEVSLDRVVAIKRISGLAGDSSLEARQRFRREVTSAARLTHPGIAQVLGYGTTDDGEHYIVMELVTGKGLRQEMESSASPRDLFALFDQILAVLSYAHARGVVHRDLKPDNILVTRVGTAPICKLLDFGVAKNDFAGAPSTREVVGTPRYMAPEQVLADPVGPAADLYAVGVMLYQALTGDMPIPGKGDRVMTRKLNEDAPLLRTTCFGPASQQLTELMAQLLERDPAMRIANAADARRALLATDEAKDAFSRDGKMPSSRPGDSADTRRDQLGLLAQSDRSLPFVGRQTERGRIADALVEVGATGEGQLVCIEGATGIGKSHLLGWFSRQVREEGGRTVIGGAYVESGGAAGDALRAGIERHLGGWGKSREQLRAAISRFFERSGAVDPEEEDALTEFLRPQIQLAAEGMASEARRTQSLALLDRILRRLAEQRPLVIHLDDLQWGGRLAMQQLAFLLAMWRQEPARILIVACLRTPLDDRETRHAFRSLATHDGSQLLRLRLTGLAPHDTRTLVSAVLEEQALPNLEMIVTRAAGNPLFAIQLARLARETDVESDESPPQSVRGTPSARRRPETAIPASVQQLIETRIDVAEKRAADASAAQKVLTEIAVLLPPVPTTLVELALSKKGVSIRDAQQALDDLVESGMVRERLVDGVEALDFEHPLVAETLLSRVQHRAMRRHSADALSLKEAYYAAAPDRVVHELAEHAYQAQLADRARELGLDAARRALGAGRYGEAMKFIRRLALPESDSGSTSVGPCAETNEIALLASRIAEETGDAQFGEAALASAIRHDDADALEMLLALARTQVRVGRVDDGAASITKAESVLAAMVERGDVVGMRPRCELMRLRASIARRSGRFADAVTLLERIIACNDDMAPAFARLVHDNLAWARHRAGEKVGALRDARTALELSAPGLERGWTLRTLAVVGADALEPEERRDHLERALSIGRELGAFRLATSALTHLGDLERAHGNWKQAAEHFQQVIKIGPNQADHDDLSESLANLAMMKFERGDIDGAMALLKERSKRRSSWERALELVEATVALSSGETDAALLELDALHEAKLTLPACWGVARAAERIDRMLREGHREDLATWARRVADNAWQSIGQRENSGAGRTFTADATEHSSDVTRRE